MSTNHKRKDHTVINIGKKCKQCIFRVPNVLRRQNSEAYTPDVVSIGPFHYYPEKRGKEELSGVSIGPFHYYPEKRGKKELKGGKEDFQLMEEVKQSYLKEILACMNITSEDLTAKVAELSDKKEEGGFEERARSFYAEKFGHISSTDFIQMMIVDGCFLIQLFRKCNDPKLRDFDDSIFNMDCMFHFLCHDILLLENQLPWFVIHSLYGLTLDIYPGEASLCVLILKAFSILPSLKQSCLSYNKQIRKSKYHCDADYLHILDLVRASIVIPLKAIDARKAARIPEEHAVHFGKKEKRDNVAISDTDLHTIRTATALSDVGIKFEPAIKESIMDIRFIEGRGILQIPQLNVGMSSETLFRNLIAIEQCYHRYSNEITSYAILMDNLISSKEDKELLRKQEVIGNWMNDEDGCKFFGNLYKDIPHNKFYYVELCKEMNVHYRKTREWHQLIGENTRRELKYLSNPWKVFYLIVGFLLLQIAPTILQTAFTIKQYYNPGS